VDVVVATDRAYLPWCATTVLSCARAVGADLVVHVVHAADVTEDDRQRLASVVDGHGSRAVFHALDGAALDALPTKGEARGGRISWARVLLPALLAELDRVLYLDADTFVVESPTALWDADLGRTPVAAVANVTHPSMRAHVASLGAGGPGEYFNAGVLLVNLRVWRDEGVADALVRFVTGRGSLPWFDQDALNAVFAGRWHRLDPKWNAMNSFWTWPSLAADVFAADAVAAARARPGILHFEGPTISKPWHYLSDHPWRKDYRSALAATPWAGTPLADKTLATRAIGRLPSAVRRPAFARLSAVRQRRAAGAG
jgi:lipopolysaccharide biosynthesis glycosyltransferase